MDLDLNTLRFNGYDSLNDFFVGVQSYPDIPTTNENYETYNVEGKNGSLIVNKGTYNDKTIPFELVLLKTDNFHQRFDSINLWLDNINDNRLIYDRVDKCYRVKKVIKDNIKRQAYYGEGEFKISFLCEPFLTDIEKTKFNITNNNFVFYYFGTQEAPLNLKVFGTGDISITLNNNTMRVSNVSDYITIDSELKQIRDNENESKDLESIGNYFYVTPGKNILSFENVSKIEAEYLALYK